MTTFKRVSDSRRLAGKATNIALSDGATFTLTAVRTAAGNLKLITWRTDGTVSRLADSNNQGGAASEIALGFARGYLITAIRDGSGNLKLISWDTDFQNKIIRVADTSHQLEPASRIAATGVGGFFLVTAHRAFGGPLKLTSWGVDLNGAITKLGDSGDQLEVVDASAISPLGGNRCLTAIRDGSGNLKLITWQISEDGTTITRLGDSGDQGRAVRSVAIGGAIDGARGDPLIEVTAVRDGTSRLKLISWEISLDGKTIIRKGDSGNLAGVALGIAVDRFPKSNPGPTHLTGFLTAVITAGWRLKLIAFAVDSSGKVTRTGDSGDRDWFPTEVALIARSDATPVLGPVTAIRDGLGVFGSWFPWFPGLGSGNLKVVNWRMQD
jgi:hypothetical protein